MALSRKSLVTIARSFLPDVGAAVRRFPLAALIAVVFTALNLFDANEVLDVDGKTWGRVSMGLNASFLWAFSIELFGESRSWARGLRFAAGLSGIAVIAALFTMPIAVSFHPWLFLLSLAVLVGLAPYLVKASSQNASFWQFNHNLWLGAGIAWLGAGLFSGGLSAIVETLQFLFEIKFPNDTHKNIWIFGMGLIAPLNWLSLTSSDFSETVAEGDQKEFTSRAVAVIVKYILVPLLLVYTAILYAYAAKIALDGVFPKGRIGPMVLSYGLMGTLTVLFAWPTRKSGGPLVALFWRHWFWLTLGPVALLFLAAYQRVNQYGLTDDRYLVVLTGLWLCAMALWFLVRRGVRDIRIIPLSLCALLFIASVGPWGAVGWSVRDQTAELAQLLEANDRMKGGQIILIENESSLPNETPRRVRSILHYLRRHERLEDIQTWFADLPDSPFSVSIDNDQLVRKVEMLVGVPKILKSKRRREVFHFNVPHPIVLQLSGFDEIVAPFFIRRNKTNNGQTTADGTSFETDLNENIVSFRYENGREIQFDIAEAAREAAELRLSESDRRWEAKRKPIRVKEKNGGGSVLLIVELWGKHGEPQLKIDSLKAWLLLKK